MNEMTKKEAIEMLRDYTTQMTRKEAVEMLKSYTTRDYYIGDVPEIDNGKTVEVSLESAIILLSKMPFSIYESGGIRSVFFGPNEVYTIGDPNKKTS